MRKISLILATFTAVISAPVIAQNVTYACQYIADSGLVWKNKQWETIKFTFQRPFFLNSINSKLTTESVGKVIGANPNRVFCHDSSMKIQSCGDWLGGSLIFNFTNLNGGVSQIFGASVEDGTPEKDSLHVRAFTCTKM